jgi:hypothetical protein
MVARYQGNLPQNYLDNKENELTPGKTENFETNRLIDIGLNFQCRRKDLSADISA